MNSEKVEINIIHAGVGEINESDVTLATASNAKKFLVLTLKLMSRQRICQKEKKFLLNISI